MTTRAEAQGAHHATLDIRSPVAAGLILALAFFGGFGAWAAVAQLESAALAAGMVVVDSNRKAVQHLEGGIVDQIFVRDGARVLAGQTLLRLSETTPRASLQLLMGQLRASIALEARLAAERDGRLSILFPGWLLAQESDPPVAEILNGQRSIFSVRRETIESQTKILEQQVAQAEEEIAGLSAEISSLDRQALLIREEIVGVEELVAKGLERKPRLLMLQRQGAAIDGARAQDVAQIARARQRIGESRLRITDLRVQMLNDVVQKLRDEQMKIADLHERIRAAEDVLSRTIIRAPARGIVVNTRVFTDGGVIGPRETVMEIVPDDESLMIEVRISPADIDVVTTGLPVYLRFAAFNQRVIPSFAGRVVQIAADRMTDQETGDSYYKARIAIEDDTARYAGFKLYPGMPVEAMIVTGSRSPLAYFVKPILLSMSRALRED